MLILKKYIQNRKHYIIGQGMFPNSLYLTEVLCHSGLNEVSIFFKYYFYILIYDFRNLPSGCARKICLELFSMDFSWMLTL